MEHASVGSIIRSVIEDTPAEFQAEEIASKVIDRIPAEMYGTYLLELVAGRVASEAGYLRGKVTPLNKNMSTKQRLIRDEYWPRFLSQKISLPTGYKALSDATTEDLIFLAQTRRSQANDLLGKAQQFEKLAELMKGAGAEKLGQLDPLLMDRALVA